MAAARADLAPRRTAMSVRDRAAMAEPLSIHHRPATAPEAHPQPLGEEKRPSGKRKAAPPARSVSPGSQTAGVLFRGSGSGPPAEPQAGDAPLAGQAFIARVVLPSLRASPAASPPPSSLCSPRRAAPPPSVPNPVRVRVGAGYGLPPLSRDYGFAYATRLASSLEHIADAYFPEQSGLRHAAPAAAVDDEALSFGSHPPSDLGRRAPDAYGFRLSAPSPPPDALRHRPRGAQRARRTGAPVPRSCISCGATKTPYWREAWAPSVLLCNACGLRFSKFRRRCVACAYVPRKEDKGARACTRCSGAWS